MSMSNSTNFRVRIWNPYFYHNWQAVSEENTAADAGENGITPTLKSNKMPMTTKSKKKATLLTKIQTHRSSTQPQFTRMFGQHSTHFGRRLQVTRTPMHHLWRYFQLKIPAMHTKAGVPTHGFHLSCGTTTRRRTQREA